MVVSNEALYHALDDLEAFDEKEIDGIIGQMLQTKVLDLRYKNILDDRKMLLLIDSLIQASEKPQFTPLKEVNLTGSKISLSNFDKLIQTIIQLQSLEHFIAKKCNLTKDYGLYLNKLLLFTKGLKTLVIGENSLGDIGLTSLSYAFSEAVNQSNNPSSSNLPSFPLSQASIYTLETLDCSQNELTDGGILSLSRSLLTFVKRSQILQAKGLSLPAPGTPNASAFVSHFAPPIIRLKRLALDNNPLITDKSAIIIAQLINSKPINAPTINASNSPNRTNSTNLVLTKQNLFPLLLEELSLSNNPQISAKGINALLGDAKQTIYSPLKKLNVSYCQLSFSVLDTLAKNIQYGMVYLEELYLEFSEEMALQCVNQSAEKIDKIYGNTSQQMIMSEVFTYLTNVLLNVNHKRVVSVRLITLGKLPQVIFSQCIQSQEENLTLKFEDCIKTLDAINPASEIFRLPYISNVDAWIQSKIYDNILYNTKPASSSRTKTTSPGPSPVASPIGKSFGNDSFNSSFLKPISMFDPSHQNDHNNLNSFPGSEDLDEEREATSLNLSSFSIPATPDRKPAKFQQASQSQSQPQGRVNPLSTSASDLSYGIAYPDKSNTSNVSKKEINGSESGFYLSNEFAVLELKEKEYLKIRKDHSKALHGLTTEIVKLVESSPTKASVSDPLPVARKEQPSSQSSNPEFEKALESLSKRIPSFNKPTASEETKTTLSSENISSNAQIPVEQIEQVIVNTLNQYLPQMTSAKKIIKNNPTSSTPGSVPVRYNSPLSLRSALQASSTAESTIYSPAPPDTPFAYLRPSSAPPSTGATSLNNKNLALSVIPETQNQIVNLSQQIHTLDNWSQNHEHRVLTDLNDLQNRVNNLEKLLSNNSSLASVQMLSNEHSSAPSKEENINQGLTSLSNRLINNLSGNKPPSSLVNDPVQNIPTFNTNQTHNIYTQAVNSDTILIQDLTKRLQLLEEILVDTYQTKKIGDATNNNIKSSQVSPAQTIASNSSFKGSPVPIPNSSQDNSQYRREIRHALLDQLLKNSPPQLNINKFSDEERSPNFDSHPIDLDPDFSYHAEGQEDFHYEDPSYKNVNEYEYQPQEEDVFPPPLQATQFGSAFKHLNSTLPANSNNSSNGSKNLKNRLYYNDDNLPPLPILTAAYHTKPHDPPPLPMEYDPSRDHLHGFDFHTPNHSAPVTPASSHSHVSRHTRNPPPSSAHSQQSVQPKEYRPLPRSSTPNKSYMLPTSAAIHKRRTPLIYQS